MHRNTKILSAGTVFYIHYYPLSEKNNKGEPIEMSLGWHVGEFDGIRYFFKEGGGGGYHCEMRVYPANGIGTVIMVNCTNFSSKKYLNTLDRAFLSN